MIEASDFIDAALERRFRFYATVPCSYFKPLIDRVSEDARLTCVGAANEGDAVAIAAGATLAGERSIVLMQNSGLGNAVNPLTSLNATFNLPVLLVVTWRAEPNTSDEPQHQLMGAITPRLLELMQIGWEVFPADAAEIPAVLDRAVHEMAANNRPYALIMRKDSVAPFGRRGSQPQPAPPARVDIEKEPADGPADRLAMLRGIVDATSPSDTIVVATTGYTGRELYAVEDRSNHFYMVGSMGCALPLGLGIALALPQRRVVVLDGDGALMMRMGAMATVGRYAPANLTHILFDNGAHLSTGGQPTGSGSVDFCEIARSCGYRRVLSGTSIAMLKRAIEPSSGPTFVRMRVSARVVEKLPRPSVTPVEVAARLRQSIAHGR